MKHVIRIAILILGLAGTFALADASQPAPDGGIIHPPTVTADGGIIHPPVNA
jgi:hypothetical protein